MFDMFWKVHLIDMFDMFWKVHLRLRFSVYSFFFVSTFWATSTLACKTRSKHDDISDMVLVFCSLYASRFIQSSSVSNLFFVDLFFVDLFFVDLFQDDNIPA